MWLFLAAAGLALLVGCAAFDQTYTIRDGAATATTAGRYETVGEVLAAAGVVLGPADIVTPGLSAEADAATPITIDRAAAVTVITPDSVTTYDTQAETLGAFWAETALSVPAGMRLLADGRPIDANQLDSIPLPQQLIFDPYKTLIITDGETRRSWRTAMLTVGEALAEAGIPVSPLDTVDPPPETQLPPTLDVTIRRAAPYRVTADGQTTDMRSGSTVVGEILTENGITLGPLDYTRPPLESTVKPGNIIQVVRVTEQIETEDIVIPYDTVYEATADLEIDNRAQASAGSPGVLQRRTRIRLEDGVEVSRTPDGEIITVTPVNEVIRYGTNIVVRTIDTPEGPVEYWRLVNMRVTAYTATSAGKNPGEPGYGITASGVQAGTGVVAVDPTVVPFRSYVYVPGYGVAFAGDTGGGVKGRFIDLGYDEDEYQSWYGYIDVYYLTPIPPPDKIRWILP